MTAFHLKDYRAVPAQLVDGVDSEPVVKLICHLCTEGSENGLLAVSTSALTLGAMANTAHDHHLAKHRDAG